MVCFLGKRASVTPMVSIIMAAILLLNFAMVDVINITSFVNNVNRRSELSINSLLANFDKVLLSNYGLYAINESSESELNNQLYEFFGDDENIYSVIFKKLRDSSYISYDNLYDVNILSTEVQFDNDLSDLGVLEKQIADIMEYKSVGNAVTSIVEKLTSLLGISSSGSAVNSINKAESFLESMYDEESVLHLALYGLSDSTPDGVNGFFLSNIYFDVDDNVQKVIDIIPSEIEFTEDSSTKINDVVNLLFLGVEAYEDCNKDALLSAERIRDYKNQCLSYLTKALNKLDNSEDNTEELKRQIDSIKTRADSFEISVVLSKLGANCDRFSAAREAVNEIRMTTKAGERVNVEKLRDSLSTISESYKKYEKVSYINHTKTSSVGSSSYTQAVDELAKGITFLPYCTNEIDDNIYEVLPSQEVFGGTTLKKAFYSFLSGDDEYIKYTKIINRLVNIEPTIEGILKEIRDDYYVDDYITTYFKNGIEIKDVNAHYLNGEVEYIIVGDSDERINASAIYAELFALRTSLNIVHLYIDKEKSQILDETANTLSLASEGVGAPFYKAVIAFSWASVEAAVDLENLENHKNVPLVKTKYDWNTSIDGTNLGTSEDHYNVSDMDYSEYLRILLAFLPMDIKLLRISDLLELNMYSETKVYNHIDSYKTEITVNISVGLKTLFYVKDNKFRFVVELTKNESY